MTQYKGKITVSTTATFPLFKLSCKL